MRRDRCGHCNGGARVLQPSTPHPSTPTLVLHTLVLHTLLLHNLVLHTLVLRTVVLRTVVLRTLVLQQSTTARSKDHLGDLWARLAENNGVKLSQPERACGRCSNVGAVAVVDGTGGASTGGGARSCVAPPPQRVCSSGQQQCDTIGTRAVCSIY